MSWCGFFGVGFGAGTAGRFRLVLGLWGGVPGALDVQLGVVFQAVRGVGVLGEVAFQPYVLGDPGKGGLQVGFGKG